MRTQSAVFQQPFLNTQPVPEECEPSDFSSAMEQVLEARYEARECAQRVCEAKKQGLPAMKQMAKMEAAIEFWENCSLKAVELANDFQELRAICRLCYQDGRAEQAAHNKMAILAWSR